LYTHRKNTVTAVSDVCMWWTDGIFVQNLRQLNKRWSVTDI